MAAGGDNAGGDEFVDAIFRALQLRRKRHLLHGRDRMEPFHHCGIGPLQVGGILRPCHVGVEEGTFKMHAQTGRTFAFCLVTLGAAAQFGQFRFGTRETRGEEPRHTIP